MTNSFNFLIFTLNFFLSLAVTLIIVFASFRYATRAETLEHVFKLLDITLREINLEKVEKQKNQLSD